MDKEEIHIGYLIKKKLKEDGQSKKWLAKEIGCCRTNIYKILDKSSIDTALLQRIAITLRKNYFVDLAEFCQKRLDELDDTKTKNTEK